MTCECKLDWTDGGAVCQECGKVRYVGNQDDGQDVADDTDDDGGYGDDEDTTGGSPTGEREP